MLFQINDNNVSTVCHKAYILLLQISFSCSCKRDPSQFQLLSNCVYTLQIMKLPGCSRCKEEQFIWKWQVMWREVFTTDYASMSSFLSPRFHVKAVFMQLRRWQQCHLKERNVTLFTFSRNLDQKKEPLERDKRMKDGVLTDRKEMASFVPNLPFFTNIYIHIYIYI